MSGQERNIEKGKVKQVRRMQTEKKQMKRAGRRQGRLAKYTICVFVLAALIAVSVMGPQLVFAMQDKYFINNIQLSERSSMDVEALNASYEKDLQERLQMFTEGLSEGKTYFATDTTYQEDEDFYVVLDNILMQEWAYFMEAIGVMPSLSYCIYEEGFDLSCWKRYIIYDKEFEDGVTFMAWYIDLTFMEGHRLQLLVDTEDYSLYYIRFQIADIERNGEVWKYIDADMVLDYAKYWYVYYNGELLSVEQKEAFYDDTTNVAVTEKESYELLEEVRTRFSEDGNCVAYEVDLPQHWMVGMDKNLEEKSFALYMGITEIGRLVPEIEKEILEIVQN